MPTLDPLPSAAAPPRSTGLNRELALLRVLLLIGCLAISLIWALESALGQVAAWDRVLYPSLLALLAAASALLTWAPRHSGVARWLAVGGFNLYVPVALAHVLFLSEGPPDEYQLLSNLYWLPMAYGTAFIFLSMRSALWLSAVVYAATFGVILWHVHRGDMALWPAYLPPMMNNLAVAQVVYVIVLIGISRLRAEAYRNEAKLDLLRQMASTDPLTGLLNRRAMGRQLDAAMSLVRRGGPPMSIILIDVDHFKRINDEGGHARGDDVLVEVASRLQAQLRLSDALARWGGEEFLVLATATPAAPAAELAERLQQALAGRAFAGGGHVTASLGVAQARAEDSVDALVRRADDLLYAAKHAGRNRVCAEPTPDQPQRVPGVTSM